MEKLLVVERMVLESLSRGEKAIDQISSDTGLSHSLLANILGLFAMRGIIKFFGGQYSLSDEGIKSYLPIINDKNAIASEAKELFTSLVNRYYDEHHKTEETNLKVRKIFLTKAEERLLNSHLANLESFLYSIEEDRKRHPRSRGSLKDLTLFIWATSKYSEVMDSFLKAV